MPSKTTTTGVFRRLAPRFRRDQGGAAAIEFALLLVPFLILLLLVLEVALLFLVSQALENGTQDAARLVRTGRASDLTIPSFKKEVCKSFWDSASCEQKIEIDVRVAANFQGAAGQTVCEGNFARGSGDDLIVVRACYPWSGSRVLPGLINFLTGFYEGIEGPKTTYSSPTVYTLTAATMFRNEPF
jgi:Flp pilus assembly pilin Flp